jgi:glycosyltransferase involved in cell wall biosynthesis
MRIGLLTTSFPRTPDDIAGTFVLGFARALAARGHEIEVLAPEPSERMEPPCWPNIRVVHVPYLRPRSWQRTFYGAGVPDNLQRDRRAYLGLVPYPIALTRRALARSAHWDALLSHWALPSALVAGLARRGKPHLAVFHSADVHLLTRLPLRRALARQLAASASALWFVTAQHRDAFLELLPTDVRPDSAQRTYVAPMGVDPPNADTAARRDRARQAFGLSRFTVLALGRLVPVKGLDTAIRAVANQSVTLLVAGKGPERERLEQLARTQHADVRWLGNVMGERKALLLSAADAFVVPSRTLESGRSEGVPHALLEALAHGLPVIATRVGGMAGFLSDGTTALLVPPDEPGQLRAAIDRLQHDHALREQIGSQGRALVEPYHWSRLGPRIEALLRT